MKKLILLLCVLGCGSQSSWSKASETSLLNRCSNAGGTPSLCTCILDQLEGSMTEEEFIKADAQAERTGQAYPELYDAFVACGPK